MVKLNCHFEKLSSSYLFLQIEKKVKNIKERVKDVDFINLGIGDITKTLPDIILEAMVKATLEIKDDISKAKYGPALGYSFLKDAIAKNEYEMLGICEDEIFISNGAKCDIANIQEIFAQDNIIAICDPTYPVYIDSNVIAGRSGPFQKGQYENIVYLPCLEENNFSPQVPNTFVDLIYLCSPNNPTGVALTYEELEKWVNYALENNAIIIFDGAYEAFIQSDNVPHSIYEIENAKKCAIEVRSFSKKAGFTGLRCSYTVIPFDLKVKNKHVRDYWIRRSEAKFGGVPYPIQKAALETFSDKGKKCTKQILNEYIYNNIERNLSNPQI